MDHSGRRLCLAGEPRLDLDRLDHDVFCCAAVERGVVGDRHLAVAFVLTRLEFAALRNVPGAAAAARSVREVRADGGAVVAAATTATAVPAAAAAATAVDLFGVGAPTVTALAELTVVAGERRGVADPPVATFRLAATLTRVGRIGGAGEGFAPLAVLSVLTSAVTALAENLARGVVAAPTGAAAAAGDDNPVVKICPALTHVGRAATAGAGRLEIVVVARRRRPRRHHRR